MLDAPTEAEERRLLLIEERDHALAALKELEFDHRTGKVDDVDYRALVGPLRRAAAEALRALDRRSQDRRTAGAGRRRSAADGDGCSSVRLRRRVLLVPARCSRSAVAAPALADDIARAEAGRRPAIDALSSKLAEHRRQEAALRSEIDGVTARIRTLEANVGDVSLQLSTLEQDLALHRERLAKLTQLFQLQTSRLISLRAAVPGRREAPRPPPRRDLRRRPAVAARVRPRLDLDRRRARQGRLHGADRARRTGASPVEVATREARDAGGTQRTKQLRRQVAGAASVITARAAQVRETRDALLSARDSLSASKEHKLVALSEL